MNVTIVQPDGSQAPEGHDAKMIAKVDERMAQVSGQEPPQATPTVRPEHIPEKFWDAENGTVRTEDLLKSYAELERAKSAPKPADPPAPVVAPAAPPANPDAAQAAVQAAGLDMAALAAEHGANGALSGASYEALQKIGVDKATVDRYIAGQQALQNQYEADVMSSAPGGAARFGEMTEWAKVNLTQAEKDAYHEAVESGDPVKAKMAVQGLGVRFLADNGSEPTLLNGNPGDVSDVYQSWAQVKVDMKDKRYSSDPAFQKAVQAKLVRSPI